MWSEKLKWDPNPQILESRIQREESHRALLQEAPVNVSLWKDGTQTPPTEEKPKAQHCKGGQWYPSIMDTWKNYVTHSFTIHSEAFK